VKPEKSVKRLFLIIFLLFLITNVNAQLEITIHSKEYPYGVASVLFCVYNPLKSEVILPNPNPWVVKDMEDNNIFAPNTQNGTTIIKFGENKCWSWDLKEQSGKYAKPGYYKIAVLTENFGRITSKNFKIVKKGGVSRKIIKKIVNNANLAAIVGSAVAPFFTTTFLGAAGFVATEIGLKVLAKKFVKFGVDPPIGDYTQKVELKEIHLELPKPKSNLEFRAYNFLQSVARISSIMDALSLTIDRYGEARKRNNTEVLGLHNESAKRFATLLTKEGLLRNLISNLDGLIYELEFIKVNMTVSSE